MNLTAIEELKQLLPQCLLPDQVRIGAALATWLRAPKPSRSTPAALSRWLDQARASAALRQQRAALPARVAYPAELPISTRKTDIIRALQKHPVVIIAGETGSGKTTQIPKMLLEAGCGQRARIGCTQPRRVAALAISRRLAEELDVPWGHEVGCKIRFADHARPETSIKVMTDGILLAEIQGDPWLSEYDAIVLDEAHERSLNIDFLLGYLRNLLRKRDDLRLVVTSATIDTERFSHAFDHAPVIEVSGRVFPVEVWYSPLEEHAEAEGEATYVDASVATVANLLQGSHTGDILVFLPSERDIRETCDRITSRFGSAVEVLSLFGRLTANEQQRVFAPATRRRVVVATNIAETSLTVPRIRYVVDTGLARISRYQPGTRSRRLPIEPIAQSNANQRKGRCGRVAEGLCIRLYAEADFQARPPYPEPEIRRCNLADVLLRMKTFQLGEIETFPFLEPPHPAAIQAAYQLLEELGALDPQRQLTPLGRDLGRLPVDPSIGRMLLQAQHEHALAEVLVIAAGLSIQDPRERPLDEQDAAETAHRQFQHPESDFLTLLNIWKAYHDSWESLKTQNQMRKFCRAHFLSFVRMREWTDLHAQLEEALDDLGKARPNTRSASPTAIHRAILAGLIGHVAQRTDTNTYRVAGGRQVMLFPGSGLFQKRKPHPQKPALSSHHRPPTNTAPHQPAWIVAGEMVETTRAFARTAAGIDPEWILELAPQLCRTAIDHPRWDREAGRVLATERVRFRGLILREQTVGYGHTHPAEATDLFLRSALVPEQLDPPYPFLEHNRHLREKIEWWQTRLHQRVVPDLDEALCAFYAARLRDVSSTHDLNRSLKAAGDDAFLRATIPDLLGEHASALDAQTVPDTVPLGSQAVPICYRYAPGEDRDGVTVQLTIPLLEVLPPGYLDWSIPALREERLLHLLRALPKPLRRPLMPLNQTCRAILDAVPAVDASFLEQVSRFLQQHRKIDIPLSAWPVSDLPPHLRPRLEILGPAGNPVAAGRDFAGLRAQLQDQGNTPPDTAWQNAVQQWERYALQNWDFADLPEQIAVTSVAGFPVLAYPGFQLEEGAVNLRLFRKPEDAARASQDGIPRLAERVLHREIAWLQKDLRALTRWKDLYVTLGPPERLIETAWRNLQLHLFPPPPAPILRCRNFLNYIAQAREQLPGLAVALSDRIGAILQKRQQALLVKRPFPGMRQQIDALLPQHFLETIPFPQLPHIPRYLQALILRAERAAVNPVKDAEKARRIQPYLEALRQLPPPARHQTNAAIDTFHWLVEELKVSVFAQELGTAVSVSPKRLDQALNEVRNAECGMRS